MRCRAVRLDLRHDSAAIAVRRKAIPLHKGCNLVLSDLLASKLVAREKNELQPRILFVPFSELRVAPIRRASSARNVHNLSSMRNLFVTCGTRVVAWTRT